MIIANKVGEGIPVVSFTLLEHAWILVNVEGNQVVNEELKLNLIGFPFMVLIKFWEIVDLL